jgi:hypothetical protein
VVFEHFDRSVYSAYARLVALCIAARMRQADDGAWVAWPGLSTIARAAGVNTSTVQRVLARELVDGPRPLFARTRGLPVTRRGKTYARHRSFVYVFVRNPEAFAVERDRARLARPPKPPKPKRDGSNLRRKPPDPAPPTPTDPIQRVRAIEHAARSVLKMMPRATVPDLSQADRTRAQIAAWRTEQTTAES